MYVHRRDAIFSSAQLFFYRGVLCPAGERTPMWEIPQGAVVDPRDVMHKDLADFYLQAAVATKLSRCTPFYRLHGFGECKVSNINMLWVRTLFLRVLSILCRYISWLQAVSVLLLYPTPGRVCYT